MCAELSMLCPAVAAAVSGGLATSTIIIIAACIVGGLLAALLIVLCIRWNRSRQGKFQLAGVDQEWSVYNVSTAAAAEGASADGSRPYLMHNMPQEMRESPSMMSGKVANDGAGASAATSESSATSADPALSPTASTTGSSGGEGDTLMI
eukprot:scpid103514/ scgid1109/ 